MLKLRFFQVYVPSSRAKHLSKEYDALIHTFGGITEILAHGAFKMPDGSICQEAIRIWEIGVPEEKVKDAIKVIQRLLVRPLLNLGESAVLVKGTDGVGRVYDR